MNELGLLVLGGLALKALGEKSAPSSPPPAPSPAPSSPPQGGGNNELAAQLGGAAASGATALLGLIGGGGAGAGGAAGGGGTVAVATTTGVATGGTGSAAAGGSAAGGAVGGAFLVGGVTAGGVFAMAWAAIFIVQFIAINIIAGMRTAALEYRARVNRMNFPLLWLHDLEWNLVEQTLQEHLRLPIPRYAEGPHDRRLQYTEHSWDPDSGSTVGISIPRGPRIYENPFLASEPRAEVAAAKWHYLQMAARLVAARYVVELGKYARGMIRGAPNLGGANPTALANTHDEIWHYPLVGGGQPDKTYAAFADELRGYGEVNTFNVDDVLRSAKFAALIQCVSVIATDPSLYPPNNSENYASVLYSALGLSGPVDHIWLDRTRFVIEPAFYKVPCQQLWLDIDKVKQGLPAKPFAPNGAERYLPIGPLGMLIPSISDFTCLVAR